MSLQVGIPIFLLSAILQATVLPHVRVLGGQPDLIVVVVLAWAILDHESEGLVWALMGGLLLDFLSGTPLGLSSLAMLPVAYVVGLTEAQAFRENLLLPVLLAGAGALAYHVLYMILLRFLGGMSVPWIEALTYVTLPSMVFDLLLIVPILRILTAWYDRLHPRRVRI